MSDKDEMPDIQAALSALREGFAKKIPDKVVGIRQSWENLKVVPSEDTAFQLLHRQTHTLSGTGATYGFDSIADYAQQIELILQSLPENRSDVMPLKNVEQLLEKLESASESIDRNSDTFAMQGHEPSSEASSDNGNLVYLVDDDDDFLNSMKIQIQAFGYDVMAFSELELFDKAVKYQEPSVVVMDVTFGDIPKAGIDHIAGINATRQQPLKAIFITGSFDIQTRLSAVRANGLAYFPKPVLVEQLVDALDRITRQRIEKPYRIVIVDDSREQSQFAALTLQQAGMQTAEVNDPLSLLNVLAEYSPDLILMDLYMPDCSGIELSQVIRQMGSCVSIPIVFLSAEKDLEKKLGALSLGGDDFLSKPVKPWHLVSAVSSRALRGRMIRKLAETDGLTGLLNHSKSKERLEAELARAKRQKTPLSFAMLDIDNFKKVNDTHGHPAGDRVLKSLANMFKQRLRQYDIVGRYGGEEFVVIFPNTDVSTAMDIMDMMRICFSKISHFSEKVNFYCEFSCGIASYPEIDTGASLNNEADRALYEAKEGGRNRVVAARL